MIFNLFGIIKMKNQILYFHATFCFAVINFNVFLSSVNGYASHCVNPGFKCSSCEELVHCVESSEGFFINPILKCNNEKNEYCSVERGGCVSDSKVCRIFGINKLDCTSVGAFPDPYDCTIYHICREEDGILVSNKHTCSEDRAYDPLTANCRFKTSHRICLEKPIPECEFSLQHGPVKENPNIYYVCSLKNGLLEPQLYKCPANKIYVESRCAESTFTSEFQCKSVGNFIDPANCYKYFECNSNLKAIHKTCRPGTYFDDKEKMCLRGTC